MSSGTVLRAVLRWYPVPVVLLLWELMSRSGLVSPRLMPGLSERENARVMALTIETLECLARDAAVRVRAILAEEIKLLDCVPKHLVLGLARDVNAIVAVPILQYSPLLSDSDLMEIIACGQVQDVLTAIANRLHQDLTGEARLLRAFRRES